MIFLGTANFTPPVASLSQRFGVLFLNYQLSEGARICRAVTWERNTPPSKQGIAREYGCLLLTPPARAQS